MPVHPAIASTFHLPEGIDSVEAAFADAVVVGVNYRGLRRALPPAGVEVRQVTATGMLHGFLDTRPDIEPVGQALDLIAEVVAGERVQVPA